MGNKLLPRSGNIIGFNLDPNPRSSMNVANPKTGKSLPRVDMGWQTRYVVDGNTLPKMKIIADMGGKSGHYKSKEFPNIARPRKSSWED